MKKLKATHLAIFAAMLVTLEVKSQKAFSWKAAGKTIYSIAGDNELTTGDLNTTHKWGWGGSMQVEIPLNSNLYILTDAGYINFYNRNRKITNEPRLPDIHFLPVKAGLKYFPFGILYIQAEAGAGFILNKSNLQFNNRTVFIYSQQLGVRIPVNRKHFLDCGLQYESASSVYDANEQLKISFFRLRIAYTFSL